jgi:hypothetical protein
MQVYFQSATGATVGGPSWNPKCCSFAFLKSGVPSWNPKYCAFAFLNTLFITNFKL